MFLFTAIYLMYIFYTVVVRETVPVRRVSGLVPVFSIYGYGKNPQDLLNRPHDVQVDRTGNLIVSDTRNGRILVLTQAGRFVKEIKDAYLKRPLGVAVSDNGKIAVADSFTQALLIFDSEGRILKRVAVSKPLKPAFYGERIYLAARGAVAVLDENGSFLFHWGSYGREIGQFSFPNGLEVSSGRLFISDTNNLRVQAYTLRGELLWNVGEPPKDLKQADRTFSLPAGVTIDGQGRIYVVDAFSDSIYVIRPDDGKIIMRAGGKRGELEGEFNQPSGIDWIEGDLFAVADKYNDRIQLVRITSASVPKNAVKEENNLVFLLLLPGGIFLVLILVLAARFIYGRRKEKLEQI
jgi:DNA-binding beta-propeller fold protein YncE